MSDIDRSDAELRAYTELSTPMKPKLSTSETASLLARATQTLRTAGDNMICLFCDRCGRPFYTNSHRSPLCGICLRATKT
jgi:hypothetical protein